MDEYAIKQKIQKACFEPRAPEELIQKVVLRAQAVTMGMQAQRRLKSAPEQEIGELAARGLLGQLALVSELPKGSRPEQLAQQLMDKPAFQAALAQGNVAQRLTSGDLMRQVADQPTLEPEPPQISVPQKEGPVMGR